jgi:hypothetical protein
MAAAFPSNMRCSVSRLEEWEGAEPEWRVYPVRPSHILEEEMPFPEESIRVG